MPLVTGAGASSSAGASTSASNPKLCATAPPAAAKGSATDVPSAPTNSFFFVLEKIGAAQEAYPFECKQEGAAWPPRGRRVAAVKPP